MKLEGITRRWTIIPTCSYYYSVYFTTVLMLMLQSYYYDTVSLKLARSIQIVFLTFFSQGGTEERFEAGAESLREFSQKTLSRFG